jgi:hypothetical protein
MAEQKGNDQMLEDAGAMDEVTRRLELDQAAVVEEERKTEAAPEDPDG